MNHKVAALSCAASSSFKGRVVTVQQQKSFCLADTQEQAGADLKEGVYTQNLQLQDVA